MVLMAADQWRKKLNGVSVAGCSAVEQYKMKRRKLESPQNGLKSKSHISLEWDENRKKVVAKKEQVGISCRNLRPFNDSVLGSHNILADVFSIPQETFELENLNEVLSYEVWQTLLSGEEKNFLVQFLPSGQNAEEVVEALLAGDNFHFGNPFLKWGASLCSGNFHPDAVLQKERSLKAEKKAYYLELQKYHNDIIVYLQKLKERWESCKDPEKEVLPKIWRSRSDAENRISSNACEFRLRDLELDVTATSESCSWVADEKACSSDNQQNSPVMKGELPKRKYEKGFIKDKSRNSLIASEDVLSVGAKSRKGVKQNKRNIHHNDGTQYMSYIKISKKQYELVKSMKQSGKSIQSRSLNRVLGNLDSLHIQPYEAFVEEEQKKLHDHWLQLANEDLPAFYASWKERQLKMWEITCSFGQEMKGKLKCLTEDEEKDNPGMEDEEEDNLGSGDEEKENLSIEEKENLNIEYEEKENPCVEEEEKENSGSDDEEKENPGIENEEKENPGIENDEKDKPASQGDEEECPESASQDQMHHGTTNNESIVEENEESAPGSPWNQSQQETTPGSDELNHMDMDPGNNCVASKSDNSSSDVCGKSSQMNTVDDSVSQEVPLSSCNVWPSISRPHSYYDCTASHGFTTSGLPLMNSQVNEDQQTHLIDLESDLHEEDMRKELLHGQPSDGSLRTYQNQDRSELLHSLFKGREMLQYHQEQKQTELDYQPPNSSMMGNNGHFPGHFQEQLQASLPLDLGQKRLNEIFMQQNISENIYSDRGRYLIPRQDNLHVGNMHNWTVNPIRISEPLESHLNGGELLSQNWFSGEHQVRGGWTNSGGVSIQSQSLGNGSNTDQSIYGVLPNCNQLRAVSPYDSMGSTEQYISSRNYGLMAGGAPAINNALPNTGHPLDYLGGRDSMMPDDMGWMNLPHQNSTLHDPMGKPYLRSWNQ